MDLIKSFEISLDITKVVPNINFHVSQNDLNNIELTVTLLKDGVPLDLTGLAPRLGILKPSEKTTYQDMVIVDAVNGKVKCTLLTQAYIEAGKVEGEIYLYDNVHDKVAVTGSRFIFTVDKAILNDESVASENDWQSINDLALSISASYDNYYTKDVTYTKQQVDTQINGINQTLSSSKLSVDMKGTTQNITLNPYGQVSQIRHVGSGDAVVRTDTFDYSTNNLIVETRTLTAGDTLTYKYHLDTLQTEVI